LRDHAKGALLALLCAVLSALASAAERADQSAPIAAACPGVAAWTKAHPEESESAMAQRDAARTLGMPELRAELAARVRRDQEARIAWLADPSNRRVRRVLAEVDEDNLAWLRKQVSENGFPSAAQVGEQGERDAWVLAQHADRAPKFQAALLPTLERRHADGELSAINLARFTDRVLLAQGQPQRYGTQFKWATGHFDLPDEQGVREIDERRRVLGIMPLADYVCMMTHARKGRL
jgi:hypothetical protein